MSSPLKKAVAAVKSGELTTLQALLKNHPELARVHDPDSEYEPGYTLLHYAASANQAPCIQLLIDAGAEQNALTQGKATALHFAASHGHAEPVHALLQAGADATLTAAGAGGTALVWALFYGEAQVAETLANHHCTPDNLRVAAGLGDLGRLVQFFEEDGSLTENAGRDTAFQRPHEGFPARPLDGTRADFIHDALGYASRNGRIEAAKLLIEHGADINDERYHGITAVHHAAYWNQAEMLAFLVGQGGKPEREDQAFKATAYGWAMYKGNREIADQLMDLGKVSLADAIERGCLDHVRRLLDQNPGSIGALDPRLGAPLHQAVQSGHLEIVALLLERGADPRLENAQGHTARALAKKLEREDIAALLDRSSGESR